MIRLDEYAYLLRWAGDRQRLVVIVSHERFPVLSRLSFDTPVVCVWEPVPFEKAYHVRKAGQAVSQLARWIDEHAVSEVCFVGYSKGGYGALLWSRILARARPDVGVSAFAMSPQTMLYPRNPNIPQPSYRKMLESAASDDQLRRDLDKFGRLPDLAGADNWHARVVYPTAVGSDQAEAMRLQGEPVELVGLDISIHNTLVPFTFDMGDIDQVRKAGAALLRSAGVSADARAVVREKRLDELVEEYHALGPQPQIPEITRSLLAASAQRPPRAPGLG